MVKSVENIYYPIVLKKWQQYRLESSEDLDLLESSSESGYLFAILSDLASVSCPFRSSSFSRESSPSSCEELSFMVFTSSLFSSFMSSPFRETGSCRCLAMANQNNDQNDNIYYHEKQMFTLTKCLQSFTSIQSTSEKLKWKHLTKRA